MNRREERLVRAELGGARGEMHIIVDPFLPEPTVVFVGDVVHCSSRSALLAQYERERRRIDAFAAFAPELLEREGLA